MIKNMESIGLRIYYSDAQKELMWDRLWEITVKARYSRAFLFTISFVAGNSRFLWDSIVF